jgi:hypothetical protein
MNYAELARKYSITICGAGHGTARIMNIFQEHLKPEDCIKTENDTYIYIEAPSFWKASAYETCMFWNFDATTRELVIRYDHGDMVYGKSNGHRKGRWTFTVPDDSVLYAEVFDKRIDNELQRIAARMFDDAEEKRRENAIAQFYNQLITA